MKTENKFVVLESGLVVPNPTQYARMNRIIRQDDPLVQLEMMANGQCPVLEELKQRVETEKTFNSIFSKDKSMLRGMALAISLGMILTSLLVFATIVIGVLF